MFDVWFCSKIGSTPADGLFSWYLQMAAGVDFSLFTACLPCPDNINILLSRGNNRNVQKEGKPSTARGLKYWCGCEVNGSKSEREGENGSYEEQGEEGKTSLVKLGSEGPGCIINEVKCVLYQWRRGGFRESSPIFTGKTALLLCSLRRSPAGWNRHSIHSGVVSHLWSG